MLKQFVVTALLMAITSPAYAIECISSKYDAQPILIFSPVSGSFSGIDANEITNELRERLKAGGKYRVLLPDQYQNALKNRQIDRCTPMFLASLKLGMRKSDAGANVGISGLVTRSDFVAQINISKLPEKITLDDFSLNEKANTFIAGAAAGKAFKRLLDNIVLEIESRRDDWVRTRTPGF